MRKLFLFLLLCLFAFSSAKPALACGTCNCSLDRGQCGMEDENNLPFFFDFDFEQIVWQKRDPALAHALHHQGHDSHVKTHEEFYHFTLGAALGERTTLLAELPYVVRHSLDVDSHAHLGSRQRSEGFGDLRLIGVYKLLMTKRGDFIGPTAGIKLPTGATKERDDYGVKFEPEMQPGSGSFDPEMGVTFEYGLGRFEFHGDAVYTLRTRGAQEYRFGNLFSAHLSADYALNPKSKYLNSFIGLESSLQNERKDRGREGVIADSGGTTWLLGPQFSVRGNKYVSVFGNILFPVVQNLGGIHQLMRFVWSAGVKIGF